MRRIAGSAGCKSHPPSGGAARGPGSGEGVGALARPDALPLATDSVDALLLPHTLELHDNPHEVLREVARVLIPEGHVVVLGFNPVSRGVP